MLYSTKTLKLAQVPPERKKKNSSRGLVLYGTTYAPSVHVHVQQQHAHVHVHVHVHAHVHAHAHVHVSMASVQV